MKKGIIIIVLLGFTGLMPLDAQRFQERSTFLLTDTLTYRKIVPVDFDNDGFLDVMLQANGIGAIAPGLQTFHFIKYDTVRGYSLQAFHQTNYETLAYDLTDYNRDNKMDILITGWKAGGWQTEVLINQGNFLFLQQALLPDGGTLVEATDLNNDGRKELVISGDNLGPFLRIYEGGPGQWRLVTDSLEVQAGSIAVADFDGDLFADLFVSGTTKDGTAFSRVLINRGDTLSFKIQPAAGLELNGELALGDYNHDGQMDILLSGTTTPGGALTTRLLLNNQGSFYNGDSIATQPGRAPLIADLDSDGLADISVMKEKNMNNLSTLVNNYQNGLDTLQFTDYMGHSYGDMDRDGDLDLLVVHQGDSAWIGNYDNTTPEINQPPIIEGLVWGAMIFDRAFAFWEKAIDDHTPQEAMSYDLSIISPSENLLLGHYDFTSENRLDVDYGNQGPDNYALIKSNTTTNPSELLFSVQALDNAFHAQATKDCQGISGGAGGGNCNEVRYFPIAACMDQYHNLRGEPGTSWFSFSEGYLGQTELYTTHFTKPDTLFSFTPMGELGCALIKVYNFYLFDSTDNVTYKTMLACEGDVLDLYIDAGGDSVIWQSSGTGYITTTDTVQYTVTLPDTVTAYIQDLAYCQKMVKFIINLNDKLAVTLNGESFQIESGQEVQLIASGGKYYHWEPGSGLNNSDIANPIASPDSTTTYTLTVTDSSGVCPGKAEVLIRVVKPGSAYIPNLFTPNGDNVNDRLSVINHSLLDVTGFRLLINNREGNRVYMSEDLNEAVQKGWDGTSNGIPQPGGVYYWSIKGKISNGDPLLLNGKSSGSILLVR
ncbi:MAG: FG-GAP-like repeat-containing protein [Cyclobacteriaceae bacterium]|nr:FG-GAP-like repeat-containing protein [Cyclobacteriaceae bacterium]